MRSGRSRNAPIVPDWERTVGLFAGAVGRGRIDKVVLGRRLVLRATADLDVVAALRHLARTTPESTTFAFARDGTTFLGATPERLVRTHGRPSRRSPRRIRSARRGPREDARLAAALLASEKDREEHAVVVTCSGEPRADRGDAACRRCAGRPALRHLQHLETPMTGTTRDEAGLLAFAGRLHPTPAVGGAPRDVALGLIDEHEGLRSRLVRRARSAGSGADGDGEFMVALRCGLVDGPRGDALRRLRHRGRLRPGPRIGGVAAQAADDAAGARWHRGGRAVTDVLALREMVQALVAAGVTDVIVCPGSRSTPLALATRRTRGSPSGSCSMNGRPGSSRSAWRERRAGRWRRRDLGHRGREPTPSVVEASLARVPLVLLTADRPPELRDRGAPQTIDQVRIFGGNVRWFAELPLLDGATETRRHARSVVGGRWRSPRGARRAGPPHIGFREPLVPDAALGPVDPADDAEGSRQASIRGRSPTSSADARSCPIGRDPARGPARRRSSGA